MVIILCHPEDESAFWLYRKLKPYVSDLELISFDELVYARKIVHYVNSVADKGFIELFDGRVIQTNLIRGLINRIRTMPQSHLSKVKSEDRNYALEEMNAFWLAWLDGLNCTVLNPARPQNIAGSWLNPASLMHFASLANLPSKTWYADTKIGADSMPNSSSSQMTVIAFNGNAFGQGIPLDIQEACCRLSMILGMSLLQIEFDLSKKQDWCFVTAHGMVNFERGGDTLIAQFVKEFAPREADE